MTDISIKHLQRAIDERPKGGMQTGTPKISLREADAVRLIAVYESMQNEIEQLKQFNAAMESERDEALVSARVSEQDSKQSRKQLEFCQNELDDWKYKKFARFSEDECWLFQDDGEDHLESLICPVVMSKDKAIELTESRCQRDELAAQNEFLKFWLSKVNNYLSSSKGGQIESKSALHLEITEALSKLDQQGAFNHNEEVIRAFIAGAMWGDSEGYLKESDAKQYAQRKYGIKDGE